MTTQELEKQELIESFKKRITDWKGTHYEDPDYELEHILNDFYGACVDVFIESDSFGEWASEWARDQGWTEVR